MYSTCFHCNNQLGSNGRIELFPVGRRIAFDSSMGRLWAVCKACERWNLSPIEERWEAIEECERAYSETKVRMSTDNVGLARLSDGTELVRIGKPMRPEFAAWRYGDQFGRRRRKAWMFSLGGVAAMGATVLGGAGFGVPLLSALPFIHVINLGTILRVAQIKREYILPLPDGGSFRPIGIPRFVARHDVSEGWGIEYGYTAKFESEQPPSMWQSRAAFINRTRNTELGRLQIRGDEAEAVLRWVLPRVNRGGASARHVQAGVELIEDAGDPRNFGTWAAGQIHKWSAQQTFGDNGDLKQLPIAARIALEMSVHEQAERRALEGELTQLEAAWKRAEEIANVADSLTVDKSVEDRLIELRGKLDRPRE